MCEFMYVHTCVRVGRVGPIIRVVHISIAPHRTFDRTHHSVVLGADGDGEEAQEDHHLPGVVLDSEEERLRVVLWFLCLGGCV
jgi:hypothetical protein